MVKLKVSKLRTFLREDIWKVKLSALPRRKAFFYRQFRIIIIAFSQFTKDKCDEKASALTFFSLLSIVPVVAMAFGIATIFGLEDYLGEELAIYFSGQQEVLEYVLEFSNKMLATSSGGVISGISALFLIYAVARLMNNIELAFNDIWDTKRGRSLKRKLTDYMSVILLGPLILILSSSATVFITTGVENLTESIKVLGFFRPTILFLIQMVPYTLIWLLLFLMYIVFPHAPVKIKPALIAGVLAGTAYQLTQWGWINGQVYLSRYSVVYGSFAALPLFLIWLQLSWMILLLGAEFAFAIQNASNWAYDNEKLYLNQKARRQFTLLILRNIIKRFEHSDEPESFENLCEKINLPRRFVREIVEDLIKARLVILVSSEDDKELYIPGMSVHKIDVYTVYNRLENMGLSTLPDQDVNEGYESVMKTIEQIDESIRTAPSNKLVRDL